MIWYTEVLVVLTICNTIAIGLLFGFYFGIATLTQNNLSNNNNHVPVICQCSGSSMSSPGFEPAVEPAPRSRRNLPAGGAGGGGGDSEEMFAVAMLMGFYMGFHANDKNVQTATASSASFSSSLPFQGAAAAAAAVASIDAGIGVSISPDAEAIILDISAQEFHNSLPDYTLEALKDKSSPQYKAYQWVISDEQPKFATNPVIRMTQRFALGTLYYATDGDTSWEQKHGWMNHNSNECEWFGCSCTSANLIQTLKLHGNGHMGTLSKEIGLLTHLEFLHLWANSLTGSIPTELALLTNLIQLGLDNNVLTGGIPTELGLLTNLQVLDLYQNQLTGTIPTHIALLTNLSVSLALSENKLVGTIPTELALLTNLQGLFLDQNELTGTIPTELSQLSSILDQLHLHTNALTGTVPEGLEDVALLERP